MPKIARKISTYKCKSTHEINILKNQELSFYGTGSYPLPPHGWHRRNRFRVSHKPFTAPYFLRAIMAYSEHVGVNLQEGGV